MFSLVSFCLVCWLVCQQDHRKTTEPISTKQILNFLKIFVNFSGNNALILMKKIAIFRWLVSMSKCNLMWILDFVLIHSQATIDGFKFRLIQGYQV